MRTALILCLLALSACGPMSPEQAAERCEERARMAQGPTGHLTLGVNSSTGGYVGGSIGVSSDYLVGADPMLVYERCVVDLTGQDPIRQPDLR